MGSGQLPGTPEKMGGSEVGRGRGRGRGEGAGVTCDKLASKGAKGGGGVALSQVT